MDYILDGLGSRNFEHMVQALAAVHVGAGLSTFGDGPDGGREATWTGPCQSFGSSSNWDGYGVVQAKFCLHPGTPKANFSWLGAEVKKELADWSNETKSREPKPQFILFATNVRLSAAAGGGKDKILSLIKSEIETLSLPVQDWCVWDYDEIRARLDASQSVRVRYAAFITPGDILNQLMEDLKWQDDLFSAAIHTHAARSFKDDNYLNLTQAGTVTDQNVSVSDVIIDLPAIVSGRTSAFDPRHALIQPSGTGLVGQLVGIFNEMHSAEDIHGTRRAVVIGGPGQGKSTATQWLAQMYRAKFIESTPASRADNIAEAVEKLNNRCREIAIPAIKARRWPFRVILTDFADYLAENENRSLIDFIAERVSYRGGHTVPSANVIKWLRSYPWIILIDGLDEVPNSSNRRVVMTAISDFFLMATTVNADVAVIATTRPQGYSDEFPPDKFIEFILAPLDASAALRYGEGLIGLRHGIGTPHFDRILKRLERAIDEPSTARLLETPLQVTILTVLLEKLGHAPRERWRLFSQYYKVITQREQEKGGELAELLQKFESDVDYLHRHVGQLLQRRGSSAGGTSATISDDEFSELISERLRSQGHDQEEIEKLQRDFSRLVTERLVFLARVTSDKIGFELRSLQEFMAADYVLNLKEDVIVPTLGRLAPSSYWRNVSLFVAGGIFADRETLRAELVLLCSDLNTQQGISNLARPGSVLAIDILYDGSCDSQPRYARGLAKSALDLVKGPQSYRLAKIVSTGEISALKMVREVARDSTECDLSTRRNRIGLMVSLGLAHTAEDDWDYLVDFVKSASVSLVSIVAEIAIDLMNDKLGSLLSDKILQCDPVTLIRALQRRNEFDIDLDEISGECDWLFTLSYLQNFDKSAECPIYVGRGKGEVPHFERNWFNQTFMPVSQSHDRLAWVLESEGGHVNWKIFRCIAQFYSAPSSQALGEVLLSFSSIAPARFPRIRGLPWVIKSCLDNANFLAEYRGDDSLAGRQLMRLAELSFDGKFGGIEEWETAERRWMAGIDVSKELPVNRKDPDSEYDWDLPFQSDVAESGYLLLGGGFQARHGSASDSSDSISQATEIVRQMISNIDAAGTGSASVELRQIVSFFSSVLLWSYSDIGKLDEHVRVEFEHLELELSTVDWISNGGPLWPMWMPWKGSLPNSNSLTLMAAYGNSRKIVDRNANILLVEMGAVTTDLENQWKYLRARILMNLPLPVEDQQVDLTVVPKGVRASMSSALAILNANQSEINLGEVDVDIQLLCSNEGDSIDADWLMRYVRNVEPEVGMAIALRSAGALLEDDPYRAAEFIEIASNIQADFSVELDWPEK
ncbi:hypothetical protein [Rhodococcus sp. NPDC006774]|uniref:NACHT domain-containing protein n=1 Tax=Rhodococcus sp. NPDC006774 TaxID=3157186 RepID=UPI0033CBE3C0